LVEHRHAELMDAGERQLHLCFRARDLNHAESRGMVYGVPEQRRLSDARLASDDQHGALTLAHVCQESVDHVAFADAVDKPGRKGGGHLAGNANRPAPLGCGRTRSRPRRMRVARSTSRIAGMPITARPQVLREPGHVGIQIAPTRRRRRTAAARRSGE
jgi:hypothetical protein